MRTLMTFYNLFSGTILGRSLLNAMTSNALLILSSLDSHYDYRVDNHRHDKKYPKTA